MSESGSLVGKAIKSIESLSSSALSRYVEHLVSTEASESDITIGKLETMGAAD